jgi:hypothetical protein
MSHLRPLYFNGKNQHAETPDNVKQQIREMYGDYYDPCPANPIKDGLKGDWDGSVAYVNPPFKDSEIWLKKCEEQAKKGKLVVALVPFRSNANWVHDRIILNPYCHEIVFVRQGIKFKGFKRKSPFPLCLAVYKGRPRIGSAKNSSINFYENVAS